VSSRAILKYSRIKPVIVSVAGRDTGTEAWKAYRRRATNTYSPGLPLAQGINFGND
jgi:hypothetical protein